MRCPTREVRGRPGWSPCVTSPAARAQSAHSSRRPSRLGPENTAVRSSGTCGRAAGPGLRSAACSDGKPPGTPRLEDKDQRTVSRSTATCGHVQEGVWLGEKMSGRPSHGLESKKGHKRSYFQNPGGNTGRPNPEKPGCMCTRIQTYMGCVYVRQTLVSHTRVVTGERPVTDP